MPCTIKETLEVVSKHDIFRIPLTARVLSADEFDAHNEKHLNEAGAPIQNSRVRERLLSRIASAKQVAPGEQEFGADDANNSREAFGMGDNSSRD